MAELRNGMIDRTAYAAKRDHWIVGLMSGTSLDGIDAVLTKIETGADGGVVAVALAGQHYLPYTDEVKSLLSALCAVETARLDDLVYAHFGLGEWYSLAVEGLLKKLARPVSSVDAVCLHGQTIWHAPTPRAFPGPDGPLSVKGTLQIGASAVVRERTGLPVISDLRSRDMAAGGEGAPLAPYIDSLLFGSPTLGRVVQNIGGIGNATVVPAGASAADLTAFDTGPGNMVIDALVRSHTGGRQHFDAGGAIALTGRADRSLVERLMADPYFSRRPPKSTGRETYGEDFTRSFQAQARALSFADQVATATEFTAESIVRAYSDFVFPRTRIDEVVVAGGGAKNTTLLALIQDRLPGVLVVTSSARGIPDDARESMAFAVMGHESLMGRPGNLPAVTGARARVVLGNVTL